MRHLRPAVARRTQLPAQPQPDRRRCATTRTVRAAGRRRTAHAATTAAILAADTGSVAVAVAEGYHRREGRREGLRPGLRPLAIPLKCLQDRRRRRRRNPLSVWPVCVCVVCGRRRIYISSCTDHHRRPKRGPRQVNITEARRVHTVKERQSERYVPERRPPSAKRRREQCGGLHAIGTYLCGCVVIGVVCLDGRHGPTIYTRGQPV